MKKNKIGDQRNKGPLWEMERVLMVIIAAVVMALNIKIFIRAGNLIPGGFNGITLLIQQIGMEFFNVNIPFTPVNLLLNAVPIYISFKYIGKKFTLYSCLMIVLSGILTDVIPAYPLTDDVLLVCIFGGIIIQSGGVETAFITGIVFAAAGLVLVLAGFRRKNHECSV